MPRLTHQKSGRQRARDHGGPAGGARYLDWLKKSGCNAGTLRRALVTTEEFCARDGFVDPVDLQAFRAKLWLHANECEMKQHAAWPWDRVLYTGALQQMGSVTLK